MAESDDGDITITSIPKLRRTSKDLKRGPASGGKRRSFDNGSSKPQLTLSLPERRSSQATQWSRSSYAPTVVDDDLAQLAISANGPPAREGAFYSGTMNFQPQYHARKGSMRRHERNHSADSQLTPPLRSPTSPLLPARSSSVSYFTERNYTTSPGNTPPLSPGGILQRSDSIGGESFADVKRRLSHRSSPTLNPRRSSLAQQTPSPNLDEDEILPADLTSSPRLLSSNSRRYRRSRQFGSPQKREKALPMTPEQLEYAQQIEAAAKKAVKRQRSIQELVTTEWAYAQDLAIIRDVYLSRAEGEDILSITSKISAAKWTTPASPHAVHDFEISPVSPRTRAVSIPNETTPTSTPPVRRATSTERFFPSFSSSVSSSMQSNEVAVMSAQDIKAIFLNITEIASFASAFSGLLNAASQSNLMESDRIGEAFLEMIPRIQSLYQIYCSKHGAALIRLDELERSGLLDQYSAEMSQLTKGITQSWNLNALLIKPVQRCLKYPLLLETILSCTPSDHPDRDNLQTALARMLQVAQEMNEAKKRNELISRIVNVPSKTVRKTSASNGLSSSLSSKPPAESSTRRPLFSTRRSRQGSASQGNASEEMKRRASAPSVVPSTSSTFSQSLSKKIGRSSQRVKQAAGFKDIVPLDTALLDELCSSFDIQYDLLDRWPEEVFQWSTSLGTVLKRQRGLTAAWAEVYRPMDDEAEVRGGMLDVLIGYDRALKICHNTIWQDACTLIDRQIVPNVQLLLDEFAKPRLLMQKRDLKMLDHQRARRASTESTSALSDYHSLTLVLTDELPIFLSAIAKAFDVIIVALAQLQSATFAKLSDVFEQFKTDVFLDLEEGDSAVSQFWQHYSSFSELLDGFASVSSARISLITGVSSAELDRRVSGNSSSASSFKRPTRSRTASSTSIQSVNSSSALGLSLSSPIAKRSRPSIPNLGSPSVRQTSYTFSSPANRDSVASSTPSFQFSARSTASTSPSNGSPPEDGLEKLPVLFQAVALADYVSEEQRDGYSLLQMKQGEELAILFEDKDEQGEQWLLARTEARSIGYVRSNNVIALR